MPDTAELDLVIDEGGRDIKRGDLVYDINEWDNYALEEALVLKERLGGTVTAVTVGPEEADETLRKCLAKGIDRAFRLTDDAFKGSDAHAVAKVLANCIKSMTYNLILTGAQAADDNYAQVGATLAELLGVEHATLVRKVEEVGSTVIKVRRELEGGFEELVEVKLPAVLSIQTGINEPRYVSIMGIRKARGKEINALNRESLGLKEDEVGECGSLTRLERLFVPPTVKEAEVLKGDPRETAIKLVRILREKELLG